MCTLENFAGTGGLAMWVSSEVFRWLETSIMAGAWTWAGAHRLPGTGDEHGSGACSGIHSGCAEAIKTNFAFGQGPDYMTEDR